MNFQNALAVRRLNEIYHVKSCPPGYVLLINIENYVNEKRPKRHGSERDFEMVKEMWEKFGYRVIEYYDLKLQEFKDAIEKFAQMREHANVDSAILFIMSHGKEDCQNPHSVNITTSDDQFVSSDWIKSRFTSRNCPLLINKPKILFFQACRGSLRDYGENMNYDSLARSELVSIGDVKVPIVTDLLIVYPTLPGYVSQRDTITGAWFVQECISVFTTDSPKADLITMLNKVDQRIRRKTCEYNALFQVVYYESWGFNKKMHFEFVNY